VVKVIEPIKMEVSDFPIKDEVERERYYISYREGSKVKKVTFPYSAKNKRKTDAYLEAQKEQAKLRAKKYNWRDEKLDEILKQIQQQ